MGARLPPAHRASLHPVRLWCCPRIDLEDRRRRAGQRDDAPRLKGSAHQAWVKRRRVIAPRAAARIGSILWWPSVIRVAGTSADVGSHEPMLDLSQRLQESNGLNAGEEVVP